MATSSTGVRTRVLAVIAAGAIAPAFVGLALGARIYSEAPAHIAPVLSILREPHDRLRLVLAFADDAFSRVGLGSLIGGCACIVAAFVIAIVALASPPAAGQEPGAQRPDWATAVAALCGLAGVGAAAQTHLGLARLHTPGEWIAFAFVPIAVVPALFAARASSAARREWGCLFGACLACAALFFGFADYARRLTWMFFRMRSAPPISPEDLEAISTTHPTLLPIVVDGAIILSMFAIPALIAGGRGPGRARAWSAWVIGLSGVVVTAGVALLSGRVAVDLQATWGMPVMHTSPFEAALSLHLESHHYGAATPPPAGTDESAATTPDAASSQAPATPPVATSAERARAPLSIEFPQHDIRTQGPLTSDDVSLSLLPQFVNGPLLRCVEKDPPTAERPYPKSRFMIVKIDASGATSSVELARTEHPSFDACAIDVFKKLRWKSRASASKVILRMTFTDAAEREAARRAFEEAARARMRALDELEDAGASRLEGMERGAP